MEKLVIIRTTEELKQLVDVIEKATFLAYDTETVSTDYNTPIIGFSIAADTGIGYYVVLKSWILELEQVAIPCSTCKGKGTVWEEPTLEYDENAAETRIPGGEFYCVDCNTAGIVFTERLGGRLVDHGLKEACQPIIESLVGKQIIMQNAVFDCEKTQYNFGVELMSSVHTDTMLLAHLLDENRPVGLKQLAVAIFGEDEKKEQAEMKASVTKNGGVLNTTLYELYKADPELIAKYGAKDAILTMKIFYHLVPQLFEQGLDKFFYDDETMPLLRGPTYSMNTTGLKVDAEKLQTLKAQLQVEIAEAKAFIHTETAELVKERYPGTTKASTFNIGANQQLAWLLFEKMGEEFGTLTEGGRELCGALGIKKPYAPSDKRSFTHSVKLSLGQLYHVKGKPKASKVRAPWTYMTVGKETLGKLALKYKWCAKLLELKKNEKLLSTYVEGIQDRLQYGIIRPSFLQHGTTSGRYSSRYPNFQNLPRKDKRIKACIIPRLGNVFIGADQSQLEPRIFAYQSGDERLIAAFNAGNDFYSVAGIETFEKYECTPQKDGSPDAFGVKYPDLRDATKVIVLASTYGANGFQLAPMLKKKTDEAQAIIDLYFERFPKVKEYQLRCHEEATTTGRVVNLFGRPRRMPKAMDIPKLFGKTEHGELPYEYRNLLNLAVNHTVQSTGASVVNRCAIAADNAFQAKGWTEVKIVLQVHDSLVVEAPEALAKEAAAILQRAMEDTVKLEGVPFEAKPLIGKSLAEV